jgi:diguanylate cyclase
MVAQRPGRKRSNSELAHGVPVFLEQVIKTLRTERETDGVRHDIVVSSDVAPTATLHGRDLLRSGFTIEQVIRDYGDVCQAVTSLAVETGARISAEEFHTFNRCLDDAIAAAVTEFAQRNTQLALADTTAELSAAQHDVRAARLRALHDSLTGLPNRELFDDRLTHAIALADRHGWTLAVMFLDLDQFKSINDAHGHTAGDAVLKTIAQRLLHNVREEDTVCRTGGDEFLYLLINPRCRTDIERIANSVLRNLAQMIVVAGVELAVKLSIGIAIYPEHGASGDQLISNADAAMYEAKKRTGGIEFYNGEKSRQSA